MGIPFDKLVIPPCEGPWAPPITRGPCRLGPGVVIDPPVVLSPMAAVTNAPFRLICRELGAGMVVTEMILAEGLARRDPRSMALLDLRPQETLVSVQLFGKDPQTLARAARVAQQAGAHAVDLNMGCPMRKVVSSGHGAALLKRPDQVYAIFRAMTAEVDIPVTGKIRAGWEDSSAVEVGLAMRDAGAAAVTIHGRTRSDFYEGHADLQVIRDLKLAVGDMVVIGNGDVRDASSARRMFWTTGCDAVMVARGALGNPWVFAQIAADLRGQTPRPPTAAERLATIRRHVALYVELQGEELACRELRKHLLWYFRQSEAEAPLRRRLASIKRTQDLDDALSEAMQLVCGGGQEGSGQLGLI